MSLRHHLRRPLEVSATEALRLVERDRIVARGGGSFVVRVTGRG